MDCLQADITRCAGITVWLRAAAVAEGPGLQISGHCAPHLHTHAAAAIPNLRHLEWFHDHVRIENSLTDNARREAAATTVYPLSLFSIQVMAKSMTSAASNRWLSAAPTLPCRPIPAASMSRAMTSNGSRPSGTTAE